jgi:hypothetical protein
VATSKGDAMGKDSKPNKHDSDRDGQGIYQPGKTENPAGYGRGRHQKDEPPGQDDPKKDS